MRTPHSVPRLRALIATAGTKPLTSAGERASEVSWDCLC